MRTWAITVLGLLAACALLYWLGPWAGPGPAAPAPVAPVAQAPAVSVPAAPAPGMTPPRAVAAHEPAAAPAPAPTAAPAKPLRKLGERAPGEPAAVAAAPPAPVPERLAQLQELPAHIQREIPTLAITGYIYASNPADRSVLINNRLRREGDTLADGFVLEKLLPKEMVLNYRGYRYRVSY
jgi:general secretion pathway protein B